MRDPSGAVAAAVAFLFLSAFCTSVGAGAWVQARNATYLKVATSFFATDREFDHNGERKPLLQGHPSFSEPSFRDFSINVYAERGLTRRLTLVGDLSYKSLRSSRTVLIGGGLVQLPEDRYTHGLADITASARYSLLRRPLVLSLQTGLKVPLGYEEKPSNDGAPLGTGNADLEVQILLGKSVGRYYGSSSIGYRRRGGRVNDELFYGLEVGRQAGHLLAKVAVAGVQNTARPPDIFGQTVISPLPGGGGALPDIVIGDQHVTKLNPALIYSVGSGLAIQADLFHTLAGTNTLRGTAASIAVVLSRPGGPDPTSN